MKQRIGLLLGSFDPVHLGHIAMATSALNSGLVDKVELVIAKKNPWKDKEPTPMHLRSEMIWAMVDQFKGLCEPNNIEYGIDAPNTSNKTLTALRERYKDTAELFIIAGTDTCQRIPLWKDYEKDIEPYFKVIEITRGGDNEIRDGEVKENYVASIDGVHGLHTLMIPHKNVDMSSTQIRDMIANGKRALYPYINDGVIKIIKENKLYGWSF